MQSMNSSNSNWGSLHSLYTNALWEDMNPSVVSPSYVKKNSKAG